LFGDFFLVCFIDTSKKIVFGANKKRNGRFVDSPSLFVPLFDAGQRGFAAQIEDK
jgi:hypothetical protein